MQYQPKNEQPIISVCRVHLSVQSPEGPGPEEEVKNLGSQGPVLTQADEQTLIIDHPVLQGTEEAGLELWPSTRTKDSGQKEGPLLSDSPLVCKAAGRGPREMPSAEQISRPVKHSLSSCHRGPGEHLLYLF